MAMSFYTRVMAAEVCFGNVYEEEPNIAYSILESVMRLDAENRGRVL